MDGVFGIFVPLQENDDPSVVVHHSGIIVTNPSLPLPSALYHQIGSSAFKSFINERLGIVYNNSQMKHLLISTQSNEVICGVGLPGKYRASQIKLSFRICSEMPKMPKFAQNCPK